jgi:hypothetical protein
LPPRDSTHVMLRSTSPTVRKPRKRPNYNLKSRPDKRYPNYVAPTPPPPWTGVPIPFLDISSHQCRAIVGSSNDTPHLVSFCGGPVALGRALTFCEHHLAIYTEPRRRR